MSWRQEHILHLQNKTQGTMKRILIDVKNLALR